MPDSCKIRLPIIHNADYSTYVNEKTYTDIANLENNIRLNYSKDLFQITGKIPERNLNGLKMESKQIQLKITMEIYLQNLCNVFRNSVEIAEFLSKDIIISNNKDIENIKDSNLKSGYLFKKNNFMGWRTKYFVLSDKYLSFYESKGGELCGNIHLKNAKVMPFNPTGLNREKFHHAFKIIEYKDDKNSIAKSAEEKIYAKHLLCSENDNDRDEWVEKIKNVIENLKKNDMSGETPSISTSHLELHNNNNPSFSAYSNTSFDNDEMYNSSNINSNENILNKNNENKEKEKEKEKEPLSIKKIPITENTLEALNPNKDNESSINSNESNSMIENIDKSDKSIKSSNESENDNNIENINDNKDDNSIENTNENKDDNNIENTNINKDDDNSIESTNENKVDNSIENANENKDDNSIGNVNVNKNDDDLENTNENGDIVVNTDNNSETKNEENYDENNEESNEETNNDDNIDTGNEGEAEDNGNIESSPSNNNGWGSSDSEDENVDVITDYDENNYLPKGFNFEDFERNNMEMILKIDEEEEEANNKNENEEDNDIDNDKDDEKETDNNDSKDGQEETEEHRKDIIIDDNERVMKQMIPPPLVPKSGLMNKQKQRLLKEEKQKRLHFSWYKFKKSGNDIEPKEPVGNKKVFGVNLEIAVQNSKIKEDYELPAIVYRCIEYLDAKGAYEEEGIYRLSGSKATIQSLKNRFDKYGDVNLLQDKEIYDVHVIAGLLKLYLRELPTTIMTKEFQPRFVEIASIPDREEKVKALANLISYLPLANYTLLRCLAAHLVRIVQNSDLNKMTLSNIAIVFGPTLGIPIGLFVLILSEFEAVFCWTTLKESEEEENIMSILFSGPEDYLTVKSVAKAQNETRNNNTSSSTTNVNIVGGKSKSYDDYPKYKSVDNVNDKGEYDSNSYENSDSDIPHFNSNAMITGSTKLRGTKSNLNVHKANTIKEEDVNIRESLSLGKEIEKLIDEKCKNLNIDSDTEQDNFETILYNKKEESTNARRRRQERSSSLFVSTPSQIDYVKSLRRLSYGDSTYSTIKRNIYNRNSQDYMDGVPDNFRLSEMFAKEIKIKETENEELLEGKDIYYENVLSQ